MKKHHSFVETVDQIVSDGVKRKILHLATQDDQFIGNRITLKGNSVVNFGSCSYLGLEFDERLKKSACDAIHNYGTQFSESRAYVSLGLYEQLEKKFEEIFGSPVVITPTTTLGHIACIPVVVGDNDAVILDHQVHNSVQNAANLLKARGIHTELLRHNRMDLLEERICELKAKHEKIWYMADGIYSMFGDACPVKEVEHLLKKYPEFHFYVDDAHGMSCFGKNGRGYVLGEINIHERMIVATSLAKAFATGGAVLVFPNKEKARKVRTCGGPLITSGPLQPAVLGAAVASADIHLSSEMETMQQELKDKILFTQILLKKYGLPVISKGQSPVFFIGVSLPKIGYGVIEKMLEAGYYLNLGIFPAVPMKNTGIRFTITRLHTFTQIENMIKELFKQFHMTIEEESFSLEAIYKAFRIEKTDACIQMKKNEDTLLKTEMKTSIKEISQSEWDGLMAGKGSFDYNGMIFLEKCFTGNMLPENNWDFEYLIIRDKNNQPVIATFFTSCIWKDDMLAPGEISSMIEAKRLHDPYYMTSRVLMTGSLFTEGQHLFIDKNNENWKKGMSLLFEIISQLQEKYNVANTLIRDFNSGDEELDKLFIDNGYFRLTMPDNHHLIQQGEFEFSNFEQKLSSKSRKHLRQDILKHAGKYDFRIAQNPTQVEIEHWYKLYQNVKNRSYELNTFNLPLKMFIEMAYNPNWQVSTLHLHPEFNPGSSDLPVAVMFSYISGKTTNFMLIGIDYNFQKEFHCYRQALYRVITYNLKNGYEKVNLGFAASFEKRKLGAEVVPTCAYMQMKDNYTMQVIGEMQKNNKNMQLS